MIRQVHFVHSCHCECDILLSPLCHCDVEVAVVSNCLFLFLRATRRNAHVGRWKDTQHLPNVAGKVTFGDCFRYSNAVCKVWKCVFHPITGSLSLSYSLLSFASSSLPEHPVMRKEPPCLWMKQVKRFITSHGALIKACARLSFPDWSFSVCEMYKSLFAHCLTWLLNRIPGLKSEK